MAISIKTPWHVWVVGIVSLLWNGFGAYDYVMTQTQNEEYLSGFSEEQLTYFETFPLWTDALWAIAIWTSVAGSICILLRMKLAELLFFISIVGFLGNTIYYVFINPLPGVSWVNHAFTGVIFVSLVLSWIYTRAMSKKGVLR